MPGIVSPVNVAAFDQLIDKKCCICKDDFLKERTILLQKESSFSFHTFRVIFSAGCKENHFVHTQCYHEDIEGADLTSDCYCPDKDICDRKVGVISDVMWLLDGWLDIDDACDPVLEILAHQKDDRLEYAELSVLEDKVGKLRGVIDKHYDAKNLYVKANAVLGDSYLFHFPEVEGDITKAVNAYQQVMNCDPSICRSILEKACSQLLKNALEDLECNLGYCFKRVKSIHALCPRSNKVTDCFADHYFLKAKIALDSTGNHVHWFVDIEKAKAFYDQFGLVSFNRKLEAECVNKCRLLIQRAQQTFGESVVSYFPLMRRIDACYPQCEAIRDSVFQSAKLHLEKTEHLFWDREFIDLNILTRFFHGLNFSRDFGGEDIRSRVRSLKNSYCYLMRGKFLAVLRTAEHFLHTTSVNPLNNKSLNCWFNSIEKFGKEWHQRKLIYLTAFSVGR